MYEFFRELLASEQPVLERFNIIDPTAVGNNVRSITLAYTPSTSDSPTSTVSLFWSDSKNKVYEKNFQDETQAKSLYAAMQSDLKQAAELTRDEKLEAASSLVKSLLKRYAIYTDEIVDGNPTPVTTTNADLKLSKVQNPLVNKTAKVVMQNLFFETPEELMQYQEKMKKNKAPGKTDVPPTAGDFKDDLTPDKEKVPGEAEDSLAPGSLSYEDYEKQKADEQKSLTKRIEKEVKDQVQSALEQKIASTFDASDDDLIDAMRGKGRTWEEIKEYFVKELKYDKDSVAAYIDAMKESEMGQSPNAPKAPSAPKPPTDLVSPETHDSLVKEIEDETKPAPVPEEEHEISQQDMSMQEIATQDTEITKIAEEPLETIPKSRPSMGEDFDFLPDKNDMSDDMTDNPASQPDPGDPTIPNMTDIPRIGDNVWVAADYETGRPGFSTKLLATYKSNGEEFGVVAMGEHESQDFPMRFLKKAFFGRLVRLVTARKQKRSEEKAIAELKAIQEEIKLVAAEIQKEADSSVVMPMLYGITDKDILAYANGSGVYMDKIQSGQMTDKDWQSLIWETGRWMPHTGREKTSQHFPMEAEYKYDPEQIARIKNMFQNLPRTSALNTEAAPPKPTRAVEPKPVEKAEPEVVGPTIEPKKIAPPEMRKEQPALVPAEAQAMWDKLKDVQIKLSKIQQAALSIQQKADEDIKKMREESGQFSLEQEELAHTQEVFQIVAALEKPVVEFRDFLAQVINQKEKVPVKWSYADKLNYLFEIMPELEKRLENAINGAQAHAKTVHVKKLKTFPKAESFQLSKYDKKAAPTDMLAYAVDNLKAAWDLLKDLMTPETPEEGGAVA